MIIVSKDNTGQFNTISSAINSIPYDNSEEVCIYIKKGIYKEKLDICKPFITLIGEDVNETILTFDDYAKKKFPDGRIYRTFNSYTIFIKGHNFTAKNITFENSAGDGDVVGQAVAAYVEADKCKFKNCRFLGHQDTLFTGPLPPSPIEGSDFGGPMEGKERVVGNQYYENCYIEGDIDFIFGSATAIFHKCEIFSKAKKFVNNSENSIYEQSNKIHGYVTAASTVDGAKFGYIFIDCKLTGDAPKHSVYLGRPWRDYAKTAFINCYLGEHIRKEGWHNWNKPNAEKCTCYVECNSYGPGASNESREPWSNIITSTESQKYINLLDTFMNL